MFLALVATGFSFLVLCLTDGSPDVVCVFWRGVSSKVPTACSRAWRLRPATLAPPCVWPTFVAMTCVATWVLLLRLRFLGNCRMLDGRL